MLRKKKNKHRLPEAELNITSLMDILTTLLFFILMVMSFNKLTILNGSSIKSGVASDSEDKQVFTLKVTVNNEKYAEIYLGPIDKLKKVDERALYRHLDRRFKGSKSNGYSKKVWAKNKAQLFERIQKEMLGIKLGFPHEHKVVIAFDDKVEYQTMIDSMSALKQYPEMYESKNLLGQSETSNILFPQVILAEK